MLWRLASAWGDSPPRNSCTTWRLNSIECVRCLAMGFLLESPVQLADSQVLHLSTPRGALQKPDIIWRGWHVRKVPQPDSFTATNNVHGCNDLLDHLVGAGEQCR